MNIFKYIILGAGPTGLSIAHTLLKNGVSHDQLLVIESNKESGGLCRSETVDGKPLDIGGGHFLDVRRSEVLKLLFEFLPEGEWDSYNRIAKINLRAQQIDHPLEGNLWQLSKADQVDYLESIARTGSVAGDPMPDSFDDWIRWKLGDRIAEEYMLPYNRKIWSMNLDLLGTYWLYKLPDVSFRDTLRSCLEGKPFGALPAHGTFLYPKNYGYGEVWKRMGEALGKSLLTNTEVISIDIESRVINNVYKGDVIINTIPWKVWLNIADVPADVAEHIHKLVHIPINVDYFPENLDTDAHWVYEPSEKVSYHRILVRHNFCPGSRGFWTETNSNRSGPVVYFRHHNEYAYPVNTIGKPEAVVEILNWAKSKKIFGAGRWGTWEHMNSDIAVSEAIKLATELLKIKSER
jgi:protoporphyrinogen oxidase